MTFKPYLRFTFTAMAIDACRFVPGPHRLARSLKLHRAKVRNTLISWEEAGHERERDHQRRQNGVRRPRRRKAVRHRSDIERPRSYGSKHPDIGASQRPRRGRQRYQGAVAQRPRRCPRARRRRHARRTHRRHRGGPHRTRGLVPLRLRALRRIIQRGQLPLARRGAHAPGLRRHRRRRALRRRWFAHAPQRLLQRGLPLRTGNSGRYASVRLGDLPSESRAAPRPGLRARHGPHRHLDA